MLAYKTKKLGFLIGREMIWKWQQGKRKMAAPTPDPVLCGLWEIKIMTKGMARGVMDRK